MLQLKMAANGSCPQESLGVRSAPASPYSKPEQADPGRPCNARLGCCLVSLPAGACNLDARFVATGFGWASKPGQEKPDGLEALPFTTSRCWGRYFWSTNGAQGKFGFNVGPGSYSSIGWWRPWPNDRWRQIERLATYTTSLRESQWHCQINKAAYLAGWPMVRQ